MSIADKMKDFRKGKISMENHDAYQRAKRRVEAKIGFFYHLAVYIFVNCLLIIINLSTNSPHLWFKWPLIGWGFAVVFHALKVFVFPGGSSIKEHLIEKEMKKQTSKSEKL